MALMHCGAQCILREVILKDKPTHLLEVSSKGTVPVLLLPEDSDSVTVKIANAGNSKNHYRVIDESIEIMYWAMTENTTRDFANAENWLATQTLNTNEITKLIEQNDFEFKPQLDKYKYSDRHPEHPQAYYLDQAMPYLKKLEAILSSTPYLGGSEFRFPDAAILPFIRQFSMVEPKQFNKLALPNLHRWLNQCINGELFLSVMNKLPPWTEGSDEPIVLFGNG